MDETEMRAIAVLAIRQLKKQMLELEAVATAEGNCLDCANPDDLLDLQHRLVALAKKLAATMLQSA